MKKKVCNFITPQNEEALNGKRLAQSSSWMTHSEFELGSGGDSSKERRSDETGPTSPEATGGLSPMMASGVAAGASSSSLRASASRSHITPVPPIALTQFKPIVNVLKRTSTTPVANLNQLINSASTDSFLNLIGHGGGALLSPLADGETGAQLTTERHQSNNKKNNRKSKELDKMKVTIHEDNDDLEPSGTERSRKKSGANNNVAGVGSVSRSLSYNIGKILEASNRLMQENQRLGSIFPNNESINKNLGILSITKYSHFEYRRL